MPALVDVIKDFRSKIRQKDDLGITIQNIVWGLEESFLFKPINSQTTKEISQYVDRRLKEYSAIHGSNPAINWPSATIIPDEHVAATGWAAAENVETPAEGLQVAHRAKDYFSRERRFNIGDFSETGRMPLLHMRIPRHDSSMTGPISYVTEYLIDHLDMTINARVITAPSTEKIDSYVWNNLSDNTPESTKELVKSTVKSNLTILVKGRNSPDIPVSESEKIATETLREMISEEEFRKYLKHGFIIVRGCSGLSYQVFGNRPHTKVWKNGKLVEEICVRIRDGNIPPTDNVIAFKTAIEADESEFRKLGNIYRNKAAA